MATKADCNTFGPRFLGGRLGRRDGLFDQIVLKILQASPLLHCFADIFWTELIFGLLVGMFIVAFWKSGWGRIINQGLVGVDPPLPSDPETEQNASEQHQHVPRSFNNEITTGIWVIAGYKTGQQPFANNLALAIWYMTTLPCCSIAKDAITSQTSNPELPSSRKPLQMASSTARNSKTSSIETQGSSNSCEKLGAERLPPPRLPAAEFPLKPMGVGSPKIWRSNEMKTSEQRIMFIIFHHGSSFFYQHLESLFLSHVASKDSAQTFASGPENIDERRKGHCGNSSFQWPFRRFPERFALVWWLLISVDCWCHGFVAATLKWEDLFYYIYIYTCIYYARGWWTSVYHFFQCSLGYQGCDPYPYGGFLKYELDGISPF